MGFMLSFNSIHVLMFNDHHHELFNNYDVSVSGQTPGTLKW